MEALRCVSRVLCIAQPALLAAAAHSAHTRLAVTAALHSVTAVLPHRGPQANNSRALLRVYMLTYSETSEEHRYVRAIDKEAQARVRV